MIVGGLPLPCPLLWVANLEDNVLGLHTSFLLSVTVHQQCAVGGCGVPYIVKLVDVNQEVFLIFAPNVEVVRLYEEVILAGWNLTIIAYETSNLDSLGVVCCSLHNL